MTLIKEVEFVLADNAQRYTGNEEDVDIGGGPEISYSEGGWRTDGPNTENREVTRSNGRVYQSQRRGSYIVLWANNAGIQEGKENFAVLKPDTVLDHIWSSWTGQRWVDEETVFADEVVEEEPIVEENIDDGNLSFRDLVEFHRAEVFAKFEVIAHQSSTPFSPSNDELEWMSENTLSLQKWNTLIIQLNEGFSMKFSTAESEYDFVIRSGSVSGSAVTNVDASEDTLTMEWVQFTEDGETTVHSGEGEIISEEALVYDSSVEYEGEELIDEKSMTISYVKSNGLPNTNTSTGGVDLVKLRTQLPEGDYKVQVWQHNAFMEDVYEGGEAVSEVAKRDYWYVKEIKPNMDSRVFADRINTLEEAQEKAQEKIDYWAEQAGLVNTMQQESNAAALRYQRAKALRNAITDDDGNITSIILGVGMMVVAIFLIFRLTAKGGDSDSE